MCVCVTARRCVMCACVGARGSVVRLSRARGCRSHPTPARRPPSPPNLNKKPHAPPPRRCPRECPDPAAPDTPVGGGGGRCDAMACSVRVPGLAAGQRCRHKRASPPTRAVEACARACRHSMHAPPRHTRGTLSSPGEGLKLRAGSSAYMRHSTACWLMRAACGARNAPHTRCTVQRQRGGVCVCVCVCV
jgi:hypothetical protein